MCDFSIRSCSKYITPVTAAIANAAYATSATATCNSTSATIFAFAGYAPNAPGNPAESASNPATIGPVNTPSNDSRYADPTRKYSSTILQEMNTKMSGSDFIGHCPTSRPRQ